MNSIFKLLLPPASLSIRRRVAAIAAFSGGWGILTGFVIFVCLSQAMNGIEGVKGLWALGGTLAAAVCVASIVEYLRESASAHHPAPSHNRRRNVASILSSVLLLVLFESCIIAFEEVSKAGLESSYTLSAIVNRVAGRNPRTTLLYAPYGNNHIVEPDGLLRELDEAQKRGSDQPGPLKRLLDYVSTEDRWRLFPETVPDSAFFVARATRAGQQETDLVRRLQIPQSTPVQTPPSAPSPATPPFLTNATSTVNVGCGIALGTPNPEKPEQPSLLMPSTFDIVAGESERARFLEFKPNERQTLICQYLNRMLLDPELYDPRDFASVELPAAVTEPLEHEQHLAAELKRLSTGPNSSETRNKINELKHRRLSVQSIVLLNQQLLATALPGHFTMPQMLDVERWLEVAALAIAWILSGGILVAGVAMVVFEVDAETDRSGTRRAIMRSVSRAAILAAVVAPLAVASYVLLTRFLTILFDLAFDQGNTRGWIWEQFSPHTSYSALLGIPVIPVMWLYWLAHWFPFSWVFTLLVLAALVRFRQSWFARVPLIWLGLGMLVLVLRQYSLLDFAWVLLLTALVWIVPAIIIGATAPFLKPGSILPASWGVIGIAGGVMLAVATVWRFDQWWWLALPAALLIFAGLIVRARWSLEEYWPIMALVICLSIAGSTALLQQASFRGVLERVHELYDVAPANGPFGENVRNMKKMSMDIAIAKTSIILPDGNGEITETRVVSPLTVRLEEEAQIEKEKDIATTRLLEIVLVSALGFWAMIGLLAAWSIRNSEVGEDNTVHPTTT